MELPNYPVIRNNTLYLKIFLLCDLAANSVSNARHGHNRPSAFPEEYSTTSQHFVFSWQEGGSGRVLLVTQGRLFLPHGTSNGT